MPRFVTRRAQAAGHVRKASLFSRRLAWHGTDGMTAAIICGAG